jgi:DNA-binding MarR family transcriptional regulator
MIVTDDDVRHVQAAYPAIYLACHTRHLQRRTSSARLSPSDGALLSHLSRRRATTPSGLAAHLGVGRPTVSAAVKRLIILGYVERRHREGDARVTELFRTDKGDAAVRAASVLDEDRVRTLLAHLKPADRARALDGLGHLARAAGQMTRTVMR